MGRPTLEQDQRFHLEFRTVLAHAASSALQPPGAQGTSSAVVSPEAGAASRPAASAAADEPAAETSVVDTVACVGSRHFLFFPLSWTLGHALEDARQRAVGVDPATAAGASDGCGSGGGSGREKGVVSAGSVGTGTEDTSPSAYYESHSSGGRGNGVNQNDLVPVAAHSGVVLDTCTLRSMTLSEVSISTSPAAPSSVLLESFGAVHFVPRRLIPMHLNAASSPSAGASADTVFKETVAAATEGASEEAWADATAQLGAASETISCAASSARIEIASGLLSWTVFVKYGKAKHEISGLDPNVHTVRDLATRAAACCAKPSLNSARLRLRLRGLFDPGFFGAHGQHMAAGAVGIAF